MSVNSPHGWIVCMSVDKWRRLFFACMLSYGKAAGPCHGVILNWTESVFTRRDKTPAHKHAFNIPIQVHTPFLTETPHQQPLRGCKCCILTLLSNAALLSLFTEIRYWRFINDTITRRLLTQHRIYQDNNKCKHHLISLTRHWVSWFLDYNGNYFVSVG